jgi:V/A-type H+-transporting ATPase subunit I
MGEYFGERIADVPYLAWATPLNIFHEPLLNIGLVLRGVILIGVVHIILGWILQAANYSMAKRKYLAFADSGLKIALLAGGTYLIFTYLFDINAWLTGAFPPILFPLIPGLLLVFMRAIGKLFHLRYFEQKSVGGLIAEGSIETMETFLSILSNVASYSRLMALGLSHLGLMLVVTTGISGIRDTLASPWAEIAITIMLVLGNFLVMLIETLVVFIHNLRLHFYEFFGKFYKGSGVPFRQFQLAHTYSEINFAAK